MDLIRSSEGAYKGITLCYSYWIIIIITTNNNNCEFTKINYREKITLKIENQSDREREEISENR